MTSPQDNRLADVMPMRPVRCLRCSTEVLVRKSSWQQTSIQWGPESMTGCATPPEDGYGICSALRTSIAESVRNGSLEIVRPDDAYNEDNEDEPYDDVQGHMNGSGGANGLGRANGLGGEGRGTGHGHGHGGPSEEQEIFDELLGHRPADLPDESA